MAQVVHQHGHCGVVHRNRRPKHCSLFRNDIVRLSRSGRESRPGNSKARQCRTIPKALLAETADAAVAVATTATTAKYFASGGICACASHSVGVPLDVVKTRVQSEPEGSPLRLEAKSSLAAGAAHIVSEEGLGALLKGAGPTFTGYFMQGSLKYGLYQVLTSGVTATGGQLILTQLLAASAADTLGSTALCPLEATRIRMVVLPGYSTSFPDAFRRLNAEEGLDGLFGTLPAVLVKQVPYTALQLVTYDQVHSGLLSAGVPPWAASLAGALSAALPASLASQPGDTLLTLLNQKPYEHPDKEDGQQGKKPKHIRAVTCAKEMVILAQELGIKGLYVGWQERLWHVGTIVVAQLLINDAVKHSLGI